MGNMQKWATAVARSDLTLAALTAYAEGNAQIVNAPVTNSSYQGLKTTTSYFVSPNVISTTTRDVTIGASSDDTRGKLLSVAAPAISGLSSTTNYAYLVDSLLDTVTDPAGRITSFSYDVGGRTKRITQPDPDGAGPLADAYTDMWGMDRPMRRIQVDLWKVCQLPLLSGTIFCRVNSKRFLRILV